MQHVAVIYTTNVDTLFKTPACSFCNDDFIAHSKKKLQLWRMKYISVKRS